MANPAKVDALKRWLRAHQAILVVAVVAWACFFFRNWEGDLHGDAVRYAAIAKTMLTTGEWLTPQDAPGVLYPNKPPLMFWLTASAFHVFGFSTWSAKLWSCLFAVGGSLLTFLIGRRLFDERVGMLAGAMLACTSGVVYNAIDCRPDSAVTFYTLLAVYAAARSADDERPAWLLLVGLAAGLGAMTKASTLVHVPILTALVLATRRRRYLLHPWLLGAAVLAAILAVPWHLAVIARHGSQFTEPYFYEQVGSRIEVGLHLLTNLRQNMLWIAVRGLPWWPLGALALMRWGRADARTRTALMLAVLWVVAVAVSMAVPPKGYDRYLIQAYPAVALLAAVGLDGLLSERARALLPRVVCGLVVVALVVLGTLPIRIHTWSARGFVTARPVLDRLLPGKPLAVHDPQRPSGRSGECVRWSIRAKSVWYLDRDVVNYKTPRAARAAGEPFVITSRRHIQAMLDTGYRLLFELDDNHRLLYHRKYLPTPVGAQRVE